MTARYILMGDVIGSSQLEARQLRKKFMRLVSDCNKEFQEEILSPYTVTLGDEFQGVAQSLRSLLHTVFYLEETALRKSLNFKIRYVAVHGEIETPINKMKAHGMMGAGLTRARDLLTNGTRRRPRFQFELPDAWLENQLNRLFFVIDGIADRWDTEDGPLILDMIANTNNVKVGTKHDKNRSQVWKRRRNLLVDEYRALKEAILDLAE